MTRQQKSMEMTAIDSEGGTLNYATCFNELDLEKEAAQQLELLH
jgi:hypothetical protein